MTRIRLVRACCRNYTRRLTASLTGAVTNGAFPMRKRDTRPRPLPKVMRRMAKINQLRAEGTVDARKERKWMNVHWTGKHVETDTKGFYSKRGKHPMRGSYNKSSRGMAIARKSWLWTPKT